MLWTARAAIRARPGAPSTAALASLGSAFGSTRSGIAVPFETRPVALRRGFFWGPSLVSREKHANQAVNDPAVQANFYRALLSSKRADVVVRRFQEPAVASSPECNELYVQALRALGRGAEADKFASENHVAAPSAGGTPQQPLHVVVSKNRRFSWFTAVFLAVNIGALLWLNDKVGSFVKVIGPEGLAGAASKMDDLKVETSDVRFKDVLGADEAREELEEVVEFLKDPTRFTGLGGKLPKGVLLTGPPGTGKTLLARAVAGEAGVPFYFMSGSEFDEVYVGVGAKRIRELFAAARQNAPAIVFVDELDAVGGKRNPKDQAYSRQTLNQLLVELDGFNPSTGIIFIGATNFPELLDKALTRPGRFDKQVQVDLPDVRGRAAILEHHAKKIEVAPSVNLLNIARGTPGFSGADLANLINQAAIHASQKRARSVTLDHLEWAKDKILLGAERRTMVMTEETRRNTAFHEAGHAIMALYTPGATPLYKATILPRGGALGITFQLPELDKYDQTRQELLARLDVCMGGRIAEEMVHGAEHVTSGCSSDLKNATSVAKAMVTSYGMSDLVGPVDLAEDWSQWSSETRNTAEQEIRKLLISSEDRTRQVLGQRSKELERLALGLLEYETLDKEEIETVVDGKRLNKQALCTNTVVQADEIRGRKLALASTASPSTASPNTSTTSTSAS